jgi:hypothetical protein
MFAASRDTVSSMHLEQAVEGARPVFELLKERY